MNIKIDDKVLKPGDHIRIYISSPNEAQKDEIFHYQAPPRGYPNDSHQSTITTIEIREK